MNNRLLAMKMNIARARQLVVTWASRSYLLALEGHGKEEGMVMAHLRESEVARARHLEATL